MGFLDSIRNIFSGARKNASEKAFLNLSEGKNINFSPKSDRYTFGRRFDTQYDKAWKPKTSDYITDSNGTIVDVNLSDDSGNFEDSGIVG